MCACAEDYTLLPDGRSCAESSPVLVYATRTSLVLTELYLDLLNPDEISAQSTVLRDNAQEARAVGAHFARGLIFYSDINTDLIYSTTRDGATWRDITANTRRVEGTVPWIVNV